MYKTKHAKPTRFDFDLIVIGTGAGGEVIAHKARKLGKKVAVIEAEEIGGECPNFGCIPTKSLLEAAHVYKVAKDGKKFGIHSNVHVAYNEVHEWKNTAVLRTGTSKGNALLKSEGITVIKGYAHFISPWVVSVRGKRYSAPQFMVATGTKPVLPPIAGLGDTGFITYREAIDLTKPPKSLFIIGGGAIGCEFAELFSAFGSKIHIADFAPRLIAQMDSEAGDLLAALFEEKGIQVHAGAKIVRVSKSGSLKVVHFEKDGVAHEVRVEEILLSSGKAPNTDLGLENAGVKYDKRGIAVNAYMQTSAKHIYAAGDVVGPYRFTHMAAYQSRIAAQNMFHRKNKVMANYHAVPMCIFTDPEIASVGATEQALKEANLQYQAASVPVSVLGRANTSDVHTGFVKVLTDKKGKLIGATVVSPRAGEIIHELTVAVQNGLKAKQLADTIHAFPTWSESVRLACQKIK